MSKNDFKTDTKPTGKKEFLHRMSGLFTCAVFLTGLYSIAGGVSCVRNIISKSWETTGTVRFVWHLLFYVIVLCAFISLVKIAVDEKPFSVTLTVCIRIIGILFLIASILVPRLPGYQSSGFEIFSTGSFVLIDGVILIPGLLLIILGGLISAGFEMQKEMDEIL